MVAWVLLLLLWVSVSPVHWLEHLGNSLKMVFEDWGEENEY